MKTTTLITAVLAAAALAAPAASQAAPKKPTRPTAAASTPAKALAQARAALLSKTGVKRRQWSYSARIGRPGAILAVHPTYAIGTRVWAGQTVGYILQRTLINAEGPTVQRSPATAGAQNVFVLYVTQVWNGRWENRHIQTRTATIQAGQNATRTPSLVLYPKGLGGYSRVIAAVFHYTPGGTQLGASMIVPNTAADQLCGGGAGRCTTYHGYLHFG